MKKNKAKPKDKTPSKAVIDLKKNKEVASFTRVKTSITIKSFNGLLEAYTKCFVKAMQVQKIPFSPATNNLTKIAKSLGAQNDLRNLLHRSVMSNNPEALRDGLYNFCKWYKNKNK